MLNGLDLFSGIGGLSIALQDWVSPVAYCESDPYCQSVLMSLMSRGLIDSRPIWDDVRTLRAELIKSPIDIIYGGFPCQDISVAGHGQGLEGDKSGLYFEIVRLISEIRPHFIFLENVPAITLRGLKRITLDITSMGYDSRWTIVSAAEMGAVHIRERWFFLAHTDSLRLRQECWTEIGWNNSQREGSMESDSPFTQGGTSESPEGFTEPRVDRTGDGLSCRVDRHRGLGNAVVPIQAKEAFKRLMGII